MTQTTADPDSRVDRAHGLQQRAVAANLAGRPAEGARLVRQGLQMLERASAADDCVSAAHTYVVARLTATLAKSVVETDGLEPALALMDGAVGTARPLADPALDAFLDGQRGLILFRGGRFAEARTFLDRAYAGTPATSALDRWRILINRGALLVESGETRSARRDLEEAVVIARAEGLPHAERIALHNLGCLEFTAGDLPRALRLMHEGMELDGETQQGIAHLDRARVLLAAGLPEEADAGLAEAADLFRRDRCWQDLGEVDLTRAEVALLTGHLGEARKLAGRARDRFRRHGNDRWRRASELVLLHADLAGGRPAARLLPHAGRLATEFGAAGFAAQARTALLLAAELELRLDDPAAATGRLRQVGPVGPADPIAVRLHSRLVRAELLERDHRQPQARRQVAHGLRELAAYQAQFGGVDLQSASAVHGRRLAAYDLELAVRSGRPGSVVAAVERTRAVSGRIRPVTPPTDERTAELLAELRRAVEAGSAGEPTAPDPSAGPSVADLQTELRSRAWLNSGSRAWQPPARLRDLRAAAAAGDCDLVTFTQLRGRLGAVVLPAAGPMRLAELGDVDTVRGWQRRLSADLDVLAHAGLPPAMTAAVTRSLRHGAAELGQLLAPALPPGDRPVVISPPSTLLAVPWPLLTPLAGRPVTVTPSLSGWHRAQQSLRSPVPVPDDAPTRTWSVTAVAGPGLPRARAEAATVAATWTPYARAVHLPAASSADVLDAMVTGRVVHVAAHGVHRGENPMFSSLSLTGGPLFAYELDQRGRVPEHVVLSACDVGRSTVRAGEEALGLTSVLLQLGTTGVVAGVARVHDDAAAEVMEGYHGQLARGRDAAESLLLAAGRVGVPSPFVCFGAAWRP